MRHSKGLELEAAKRFPHVYSVRGSCKQRRRGRGILSQPERQVDVTAALRPEGRGKPLNLFPDLLRSTTDPPSGASAQSSQQAPRQRKEPRPRHRRRYRADMVSPNMLFCDRGPEPSPRRTRDRTPSLRGLPRQHSKLGFSRWGRLHTQGHSATLRARGKELTPLLPHSSITCFRCVLLLNGTSQSQSLRKNITVNVTTWITTLGLGVAVLGGHCFGGPVSSPHGNPQGGEEARGRKRQEDSSQSSFLTRQGQSRA